MQWPSEPSCRKPLRPSPRPARHGKTEEKGQLLKVRQSFLGLASHTNNDASHVVTEGPVNDILGRRIATAIYDDATQRNKETATLAEVLRCRLPKRGGVTKERAGKWYRIISCVSL